MDFQIKIEPKILLRIMLIKKGTGPVGCPFFNYPGVLVGAAEVLSAKAGISVLHSKLAAKTRVGVLAKLTTNVLASKGGETAILAASLLG